MPPRRASYELVVQILGMLRLLEHTAARALPVNRIAEELGVHRRTVLRWVEAVGSEVENEDGEPLLVREHREGIAWIRMPRAGPSLSSTVYQYAAAFAAASHLKPGRSLLGSLAAEALERLAMGAGKDPAGLLKRVPTAFHYLPFAPKDYRENADVFDAVVAACLRSHPLDIDYRDASGHRSRQRIEPYTLVMYRDGFYVLAHRVAPEPAALRTYAVDRMEQAKAVRAARFEVPKDYDPARHFAGGLGLWHSDESPETVEIAFHPDVFTGIRERRWPGFAGWRRTKDGRDVLKLVVPLTPELVTWALGWGPAAEVLSPAKLREEVRAEMATALARYGKARAPRRKRRS